ncbi:hypothetical protein [Pseudomonas quasicaspiana]|uniref:hypothetical protein n=1 Tax=Pseudomonas quasicaspiana TaxID=2829821 RepID=UPI001E4F8630|nr:hypothetical protein [Pseudomonas quasicaspiana]MCD5980551.1 hypothetical protein [Pseudomonas quasicaspiana]
MRNAESVKPATKRQRKRRAKLKVEGIKEISFRLKPALGEVLASSMAIRSGAGEPFDIEEYMCALIREDAARLKGQIADAQRYPCRQCGKTLPDGCGGAFKGELACLHTPVAWKLLIPTVDA